MSAVKQGVLWFVATLLLVTAASTLGGAAYDVNHDHGNFVGLHMGILLGASGGIVCGAIMGCCRWDIVRVYRT